MTARTIVARVPSASTPGRRYAVRRFSTGLDCECPAFGFSRAKACSHTRLAEAAVRATLRCFAAGHVGAALSKRGFNASMTIYDELHAVGRGPSGLGRTADWICLQCVVDLLAAAARKVRRTYVPKATIVAQRAAKRARKKEAKQRGNK